MTPRSAPVADGMSGSRLTPVGPLLRNLASSGSGGWLFPAEAAGRVAVAAPAGTLGRIGALEVRLAATLKEVRRAQRLRYRVFYEERSALPSALARLSRRDADAFDSICDHLLVLDHAARPKPFRNPKPKVVGTYRLLRREVAEAHFGFYSASEYDLGPLLAARPETRFLEMGRSCVLAPYRSRKTVELLWQGIWAYVLRHGIEALIGCASLEGTRVQDLALPLSFLHHHAASPEEWRVTALPGRHVSMDLLRREAIDPKAAFKALPPLVKGYLRCGAHFGEGAVVDHEFGTTDVFAVMPIASISDRILGHFGPGPQPLRGLIGTPPATDMNLSSASAVAWACRRVPTASA